MVRYFFNMKITLIQFGKTHFRFVEDGFTMYADRLKHYTKFSHTQIELPTRLKSADPDSIKKFEAELLLKKVLPNDFLILLDERGKEYHSIGFAAYLEKLSIQQASVVFVIGGAFGFHHDIYERANAKVSLSTMTYSHQLIRLIFMEQLYRAYTIMRNEPYHHE